MTIFYRNLFLKNLFCKYKNFKPYNFCSKVLAETCFRGNNLATIKNFRPKIFLFKIFIGTYFRGNDFATIKILNKKLLFKIFGRNLFSRELFCNHKKFSTIKFLMKISRKNLLSCK